MQIDREHPKAKPKTITVRIDATQLDDRVVALLQGFLASDPRILAVEAELPHIEILPPDDEEALDQRDSEGMGFLTISAAAEPVILAVHFISAHAKEIKEIAMKTGEGGAGTLGAALVQYVIKRIKQLKKTRGSFKYIEILGADGDVVKLVKITTEKKH